MVAPAALVDVALLGDADLAVGLAVVTLETERRPAVDAAGAVEVGCKPEVERGPHLGLDVAAEVLDLGDVTAVDDDGLDEGVLF